jgi:hypothetical protein
MGTKIYNLPFEIKCVDNFKGFKRKLKNIYCIAAFTLSMSFLSNVD